MRDTGSRPFTADGRQAFLQAVHLYARELASESHRVARRLKLGVISRGCVELAVTALTVGNSRGDTPLGLSVGGLLAGAGLGYALELSTTRLMPMAEIAVALGLLGAGALSMALAGRGGAGRR